MVLFNYFKVEKEVLIGINVLDNEYINLLNDFWYI